MDVPQYLVEGGGHESTMDRTRWTLIRGSEHPRRMGMSIVSSTDRERWSEGIGEADHRTLVEEGADIAGIRRLSNEPRVLQTRMILQCFCISLECIGCALQFVNGRVARNQPLDDETHCRRETSLLGPHLGLTELGGIPVRVDLGFFRIGHGLLLWDPPKMEK